MDFSKSEPNPDKPREVYVLAQRLVEGDRIMVRCEQPSTKLVFDEDRTVVSAVKERGRVYLKLEPKRDAQDEFDVPVGHRFTAVDVAHPITIKGQR